MTFSIKLANGMEAEFASGAELADWYERMVPKTNIKKKEQVDSKKVVEQKK